MDTCGDLRLYLKREHVRLSAAAARLVRVKTKVDKALLKNRVAGSDQLLTSIECAEALLANAKEKLDAVTAAEGSDVAELKRDWDRAYYELAMAIRAAVSRFP